MATTSDPRNHFHASFLEANVLDIAAAEDFQNLLTRRGLWDFFGDLTKMFSSQSKVYFLQHETSRRSTQALKECLLLFLNLKDAEFRMTSDRRDYVAQITVTAIEVAWPKISEDAKTAFLKDIRALSKEYPYDEHLKPLLKILGKMKKEFEKDEIIQIPAIKSLKDECFVIMPFTGKYGGVYENIFKPAILKAKLVPYRADESPTSMQFTTLIKDRIRSAKAVLAFIDVRNGKVDGKSEMFFNPNVMYEVGMAIMTQSQDSEIHRTLIYSNEPAKMPADLRHFNIQSLPMSSGHDSKTIETIKDGLLAIQAQE